MEPSRSWIEEKELGLPWWRYVTEKGEVTLEPRPPYCDRGQWIAKSFLNLTNPHDSADGWPRYYMDLERAKLELEDYVALRLSKE